MKESPVLYGADPGIYSTGRCAAAGCWIDLNSRSAAKRKQTLFQCLLSSYQVPISKQRYGILYLVRLLVRQGILLRITKLQKPMAERTIITSQKPVRLLSPVLGAFESFGLAAA